MGKGAYIGQARAFALAPPQKRISLPRGKGIKGMGCCDCINIAKVMINHPNYSWILDCSGEKVLLVFGFTEGRCVVIGWHQNK
jgi:hypothetical protein